MQMLFEGSEESPGVPGLSVLPGSCRLLPDDVKRPQMPCNLLERRGDPELLSLAPDPAWAYFVHAYAADTDNDLVTATSDYGATVDANTTQSTVWQRRFHTGHQRRPSACRLKAPVAQAPTT